MPRILEIFLESNKSHEKACNNKKIDRFDENNCYEILNSNNINKFSEIFERYNVPFAYYCHLLKTPESINEVDGLECSNDLKLENTSSIETFASSNDFTTKTESITEVDNLEYSNIFEMKLENTSGIDNLECSNGIDQSNMIIKFKTNDLVENKMVLKSTGNYVSDPSCNEVDMLQLSDVDETDPSCNEVNMLQPSDVDKIHWTMKCIEQINCLSY